MTQAIPTSVPTEGEPPVYARTLVTGGRLLIAANVGLQLTVLFAYLYLRANNFGGQWRPSGIGPPNAVAVAAMIVPFASVVLLWAAARPSRGGLARTGVTALLAGSLLVALLTVGLRVYLQYHLGWFIYDSNSDTYGGGYVDVSTFWYALMLAEFALGLFWVASLYAGQARRTVPATPAQLRAAFEYWAFVSIVALGVFALVQFVT